MGDRFDDIGAEIARKVKLPFIEQVDSLGWDIAKIIRTEVQVQIEKDAKIAESIFAESDTHDPEEEDWIYQQDVAAAIREQK